MRARLRPKGLASFNKEKEKETNMKTKSTQAAFFNPRILVGLALCSVGLLMAFASLSESVTGTDAATPDTGLSTLNKDSQLHLRLTELLGRLHY